MLPCILQSCCIIISVSDYDFNIIGDLKAIINYKFKFVFLSNLNVCSIYVKHFLEVSAKSAKVGVCVRIIRTFNIQLYFTNP